MKRSLSASQLSQCGEDAKKLRVVQEPAADLQQRQHSRLSKICGLQLRHGVLVAAHPASAAGTSTHGGGGGGGGVCGNAFSKACSTGPPVIDLELGPCASCRFHQAMPHGASAVLLKGMTNPEHWHAAKSLVNSGCYHSVQVRHSNDGTVILLTATASVADSTVAVCSCAARNARPQAELVQPEDDSGGQDGNWLDAPVTARSTPVAYNVEVLLDAQSLSILDCTSSCCGTGVDAMHCQLCPLPLGLALYGHLCSDSVLCEQDLKAVVDQAGGSVLGSLHFEHLLHGERHRVWATLAALSGGRLTCPAEAGGASAADFGVKLCTQGKAPVGPEDSTASPEEQQNAHASPGELPKDVLTAGPLLVSAPGCVLPRPPPALHACLIPDEHGSKPAVDSAAEVTSSSYSSDSALKLGRGNGRRSDMPGVVARCVSFATFTEKVVSEQAGRAGFQSELWRARMRTLCLRPNSSTTGQAESVPGDWPTFVMEAFSDAAGSVDGNSARGSVAVTNLMRTLWMGLHAWPLDHALVKDMIHAVKRIALCCDLPRYVRRGVALKLRLWHLKVRASLLREPAPRAYYEDLSGPWRTIMDALLQASAVMQDGWHAPRLVKALEETDASVASGALVGVMDRPLPLWDLQGRLAWLEVHQLSDAYVNMALAAAGEAGFHQAVRKLLQIGGRPNIVRGTQYAIKSLSKPSGKLEIASYLLKTQTATPVIPSDTNSLAATTIGAAEQAAAQYYATNPAHLRDQHPSGANVAAGGAGSAQQRDHLLTSFAVRCAHDILLSAVEALMELTPGMALQPSPNLKQALEQHSMLQSKDANNIWLGLLKQIIYLWDQSAQETERLQTARDAELELELQQINNNGSTASAEATATTAEAVGSAAEASASAAASAPAGSSAAAPVDGTSGELRLDEDMVFLGQPGAGAAAAAAAAAASSTDEPIQAVQLQPADLCFVRGAEQLKAVQTVLPPKSKDRATVSTLALSVVQSLYLPHMAALASADKPSKQELLSLLHELRRMTEFCCDDSMPQAVQLLALLQSVVTALVTAATYHMSLADRHGNSLTVSIGKSSLLDCTSAQLMSVGQLRLALMTAQIHQQHVGSVSAAAGLMNAAVAVGPEAQAAACQQIFLKLQKPPAGDKPPVPAPAAPAARVDDRPYGDHGGHHHHHHHHHHHRPHQYLRYDEDAEEYEYMYEDEMYSDGSGSDMDMYDEIGMDAGHRHDMDDFDQLVMAHIAGVENPRFHNGVVIGDPPAAAAAAQPPRATGNDDDVMSSSVDTAELMAKGPALHYDAEASTDDSAHSRKRKSKDAADRAAGSKKGVIAGGDGAGPSGTGGGAMGINDGAGPSGTGGSTRGDADGNGAGPSGTGGSGDAVAGKLDGVIDCTGDGSADGTAAVPAVQNHPILAVLQASGAELRKMFTPAYDSHGDDFAYFLLAQYLRGRSADTHIICTLMAAAVKCLDNQPAGHHSGDWTAFMAPFTVHAQPPHQKFMRPTPERPEVTVQLTLKGLPCEDWTTFIAQVRNSRPPNSPLQLEIMTAWAVATFAQSPDELQDVLRAMAAAVFPVAKDSPAVQAAGQVGQAGQAGRPTAAGTSLPVQAALTAGQAAVPPRASTSTSPAGQAGQASLAGQAVRGVSMREAVDAALSAPGPEVVVDGVAESRLTLPVRSSASLAHLAVALQRSGLDELAIRVAEAGLLPRMHGYTAMCQVYGGLVVNRELYTRCLLELAPGLLVVYRRLEAADAASRLAAAEAAARLAAATPPPAPVAMVSAPQQPAATSSHATSAHSPSRSASPALPPARAALPVPPFMRTASPGLPSAGAAAAATAAWPWSLTPSVTPPPSLQQQQQLLQHHMLQHHQHLMQQQLQHRQLLQQQQAPASTLAAAASMAMAAAAALQAAPGGPGQLPPWAAQFLPAAWGVPPRAGQPPLLMRPAGSLPMAMPQGAQAALPSSSSVGVGLPPSAQAQLAVLQPSVPLPPGVLPPPGAALPPGALLPPGAPQPSFLQIVMSNPVWRTAVGLSPPAADTPSAINPAAPVGTQNNLSHQQAATAAVAAAQAATIPVIRSILQQMVAGQIPTNATFIQAVQMSAMLHPSVNTNSHPPITAVPGIVGARSISPPDASAALASSAGVLPTAAAPLCATTPPVAIVPPAVSDLTAVTAPAAATDPGDVVAPSATADLAVTSVPPAAAGGTVTPGVSSALAVLQVLHSSSAASAASAGTDAAAATAGQPLDGGHAATSSPPPCTSAVADAAVAQPPPATAAAAAPATASPACAQGDAAVESVDMEADSFEAVALTQLARPTVTLSQTRTVLADLSRTMVFYDTPLLPELLGCPAVSHSVMRLFSEILRRVCPNDIGGLSDKVIAYLRRLRTCPRGDAAPNVLPRSGSAKDWAQYVMQGCVMRPLHQAPPAEQQAFILCIAGMTDTELDFRLKVPLLEFATNDTVPLSAMFAVASRAVSEAARIMERQQHEQRQALEQQRVAAGKKQEATALAWQQQQQNGATAGGSGAVPPAGLGGPSVAELELEAIQSLPAWLHAKQRALADPAVLQAAKAAQGAAASSGGGQRQWVWHVLNWIGSKVTLTGNDSEADPSSSAAAAAAAAPAKRDAALHELLVRQLMADVGGFRGPELLPLAVAVIDAGMVVDGLAMGRRAVLPACGTWTSLQSNEAFYSPEYRTHLDRLMRHAIHATQGVFPAATDPHASHQNRHNGGGGGASGGFNSASLLPSAVCLDLARLCAVTYLHCSGGIKALSKVHGFMAEMDVLEARLGLSSGQGHGTAVALLVSPKMAEALELEVSQSPVCPDAKQLVVHRALLPHIASQESTVGPSLEQAACLRFLQVQMLVLSHLPLPPLVSDWGAPPANGGGPGPSQLSSNVVSELLRRVPGMTHSQNVAIWQRVINDIVSMRPVEQALVNSSPSCAQAWSHVRNALLILHPSISQPAMDALPQWLLRPVLLMRIRMATDFLLYLNGASPPPPPAGMTTSALGVCTPDHKAHFQGLASNDRTARFNIFTNDWLRLFLLDRMLAMDALGGEVSRGPVVTAAECQQLGNMRDFATAFGEVVRQHRDLWVIHKRCRATLPQLDSKILRFLTKDPNCTVDALMTKIAKTFTVVEIDHLKAIHLPWQSNVLGQKHLRARELAEWLHSNARAYIEDSYNHYLPPRGGWGHRNLY